MQTSERGTARFASSVKNAEPPPRRVVKLPFSANLGLIRAGSLHLNLILAPFAVLGAAAGRTLIPHINQKLFEQLALAFPLLAGPRLCF